MSVAAMGTIQPEQVSVQTVSAVEDDQVAYVAREQYEKLLKDYEKLKEKYESSENPTPKDPGQPSLEACMGRLERFEYLMKELQEDFRDIKATIRARPTTTSNRTETRETAVRRVPRDDDTINFIMTIVHPKRQVE